MSFSIKYVAHTDRYGKFRNYVRFFREYLELFERIGGPIKGRFNGFVSVLSSSHCKDSFFNALGECRLLPRRRSQQEFSHLPLSTDHASRAVTFTCTDCQSNVTARVLNDLVLFTLVYHAHVNPETICD